MGNWPIVINLKKKDFCFVVIDIVKKKKLY